MGWRRREVCEGCFVPGERESSGRESRVRCKTLSKESSRTKATCVDGGWRARRRWALGWMRRDARRRVSGTASPRAPLCSMQQRPSCAILKFQKRGGSPLSTPLARARSCMALERGRTRSSCFRSGLHRRLSARAGWTTRKESADGCAAAAEACSTPRPGRGEGTPVLGGATVWRCDDEWREAYVELMRADPRNTTKWKACAWTGCLLGAPVHARAGVWLLLRRGDP